VGRNDGGNLQAGIWQLSSSKNTIQGNKKKPSTIKRAILNIGAGKL
jgi:hypothetical protein